MTATLILKMQNDPNVEVASGAVVSLQRVWLTQRAEAERMNVSLTPEQGLDGREVAVVPGRWLIEGTLGSGDVVSELVDVAEGDRTTVVLTLPDKSPHEWLGWQFNTGNVEGMAALGELIEQAKAMALKADEKYQIAVRARMFSRTLKSSAKSGAARLALGLSTLREKFDPDGNISKVIASVQRELNKHASPESAPAVRIIRYRQNDDGRIPHGRWAPFLDEVDQEAIEQKTALEPFITSVYERMFLYRPSPEHHSTRRFLEVEWDSESYKLTLPEPWLDISTSRETGSELLVRKHPLDGSLKASIAVLDPVFSTISAMMMTSAMPKAAVFVNEHLDQLFAQNGLSSAAASYVMLSSGNVDRLTLDLIRRFEAESSTPDALTIAAWRMIRFPEQGQDPVGPTVLRAFRAGPPYFSIGMGWLLDALTMIGPDDDEAAKYADVVKQVSIRLDTTQIFTTVKEAKKPEQGHGFGAEEGGGSTTVLHRK